jgi:GxxExxY protein
MTQTTADQHKPRDPRTARVLAAYFGVYRTLGWGYLESVYRRSMITGLRRLGATVEEEVPLEVRYLGEVVGEFRADLIVDREVIVEVKVADRLTTAHRMQVTNYLKATKLEVGMLLNFGPSPAYQRVVFSKERKEPQPLRFEP